MPDWKDEAQHLSTLRAVELGRRMRPGQSVHPYLVPAVRVFGDILSSGIGRTYEQFSRELAVLCAWATEGKGRTYDGPKVQGGERPEPDPRGVWSDRKLAQVEQTLWNLMLELRSYNEHPHDPQARRGECPNCGAKRPRKSVYCGMCGRFLATPTEAQPPSADAADELAARRRHRSRRCPKRCANRDKRLPAWQVTCNVCGSETIT